MYSYPSTTHPYSPKFIDAISIINPNVNTQRMVFKTKSKMQKQVYTSQSSNDIGTAKSLQVQSNMASSTNIRVCGRPRGLGGGSRQWATASAWGLEPSAGPGESWPGGGGGIYLSSYEQFSNWSQSPGLIIRPRSRAPSAHVRSSETLIQMRPEPLHVQILLGNSMYFCVFCYFAADMYQL